MAENKFDFSRRFNMKKFYDTYMSKFLDDKEIGVGAIVFVRALASRNFTSQQELSEYVSCNKAHTSRILSKMQEKGLIRMVNTKSTGTAINLTEKGKNLAKQAESLNKKYEQMLIENISAKDLEVFIKVLNQIYLNAETLTSK
jgi:DNA-binding MarR family transcriptional regulator